MKLRLARHGRKDRPYYWIMAADRVHRFLTHAGLVTPKTFPAQAKSSPES